MPGIGDVRRLYAAAVEDTLTEVAIRVLNEATENIRKSGSIDTGELVGSGSIREEPGLRRVGFSAPQSVWVHFGTPPHWPPLEPIREWVARNLNVNPTGELEIRPDADTPRKKAPVDAITRVAKAIQYKISIHGTDAKPFLSQAISAHQGSLGATLKKHLDRRGL